MTGSAAAIASPFPPDFGEAVPRMVARLAERHARIVGANRDWFKGRRVLDLASSNGRWTWAALDAGASEAVGVEGRPERIVDAERIIAGTSHAGRAAFVPGDIYDHLWALAPGRFDTILCLGVYYHVMDHYMLMRLMARQQAECIIIDSGFIPRFSLETSVTTEDPGLYSSALPAYAGQDAELAGKVSLGLMIEMARNTGYRVEPVVWRRSECAHPGAVRDYLAGKRFTLRLLRTDRAALAADDWRGRWRDALTEMGLDVGRIIDSPLKAAEAAAAARQAVFKAKHARVARGEM